MGIYVLSVLDMNVKAFLSLHGVYLKLYRHEYVVFS